MKGKGKIQQQTTVSAHTMEVIKKSFVSTLKWLEFYIEKSGYSGNWQRQIPEQVERQDLNDQPSEIKKFMETSLLALDGVIDDKPDFVLENLQEQFYSWLDKSGIRIDNCSEELVECLVNIYKVLINDGKEFVERVDREASEDIAKMTPEERREKFYKTFTLAQKLMDSAEARKKSLEGKTYKDVDTKNKFSGNPDQGKKLFDQIRNRHSANFSGIDFDKVVEGLKADPKNYWRLDEVPTEINNFSGAVKKQEWLLIRWDARENDFDQEGKLNFNNNPLYRWESFNVCQRFEIKKFLEISVEYLTNEEIKWVVEEVKENLGVWRVGIDKGQTYLIHNSAQGKDKKEWGTLIHSQQNFSEVEWAEINGILGRINYIKQNTRLEKNIVVFDSENGKYYEADDYFVHNEWKSTNRAGCLIFNSNAMFRAKDLTEAEQKEVGYKLETSHQVQNQNRPSGGKGGFGGWGSSIIFTSVSVVSLIGLAFTR